MQGARSPLLLVLAIAAAAGVAAREPPPGLAGLVIPAQVPDGPPGCVRVDVARKLALRAAPSTQSPRIGWLAFAPWRDASGECDVVLPHFEASAKAGRRPVPSFESDYDTLALAVLERQGDWLRLDLGGDSGWLHRPPGYRFEAYPDLLVGKLAYAMPAWRGELCASPGSDCRRLEATPEQPLAVHSVSQRGDSAWLEVELTNDPCRGDEPSVLQRGWIRATAERRPTAWFHSRGC